MNTAAATIAVTNSAAGPDADREESLPDGSGKRSPG